MTPKQTLIAIGFAALVSAGVAFFRSFDNPRTYEECVIKNVKNAQTEQAARSTEYACRRMFNITDIPGAPPPKAPRQSQTPGDYDDIFLKKDKPQ